MKETINFSRLKRDLFNYYRNKIYNIWQSKYTIKELDREQNDFIFKKFWETGRISGFVLPTKIEGREYDSAIFTDFAPIWYNIYDWPTKVTLINKRGVKFISPLPQEVDKDVVIGYAQKNKKPVAYMVDLMIAKIVDVEIVIKLNLRAHKMPFIYNMTQENKEALNNIKRNLENDAPDLFASVQDIKDISVLVSGAPYIIDKLYAYLTALLNDLKEYLGVSNLGIFEKKEHLITAEVEANNQVTESSGDSFKASISEFCDKFGEVFGMTLTLVDNNEIKYQESQEEEDIENDFE